MLLVLCDDLFNQYPSAKMMARKHEDTSSRGSLASPEASIVSSHSSNLHPFDGNEGGASSFLSVTPSMLDSRIYDDECSQEESAVDSFDTAPEMIPWYDSSTFENIGSQLAESGDSAVPSMTSVSGSEDIPNTSESRRGKTAVSVALEVGSMIVGVAGVLLLLGLGSLAYNDSNTATKKANKRNRRKSWPLSD